MKKNINFNLSEVNILKKMKINRKTFVFIILMFFVVGGGAFGIDYLLNNVKKNVPIVKTEEEIRIEEYKRAITQSFVIGTEKSTVIEQLSVPMKNISKNYIVNPNYTRIGKHDFLTTFIFENEKLVAILHERFLDGNQKHHLAVEFQKFTSEVSEAYPLSNVKEEWFVPELNYDSNIWNSQIIENNLELISYHEVEGNEEHIQIIASGINYFDFLMNETENLDVGNLILIYTSKDYKDKLLTLISLVSN